MIDKITSGSMTIFDWIALAVSLFFAGALPLFVLAPLITGTVKPLIDDWTGMNK